MGLDLVNDEDIQQLADKFQVSVGSEIGNAKIDLKTKAPNSELDAWRSCVAEPSRVRIDWVNSKVK